MEPSALVPQTTRRFERDGAGGEIARLKAALEAERAARMRAERAASDLARIVAVENRRVRDEIAAREEAEKVASNMAKLVAFENARANSAEQQLQDFLGLQ